jgi:hypothetical protein
MAGVTGGWEFSAGTPAGVGVTTAGGSTWAAGRGARRLEIAGTPMETAATRPAAITVIRFQRLVPTLLFVAIWFRSFCMNGRRSGTLSSASASAVSTENGTLRPRPLKGRGVSCTWLSKISSRLLASKGAAPASIW